MTRLRERVSVLNPLDVVTAWLVEDERGWLRLAG
jgi:hypothetical protein